MVQALDAERFHLAPPLNQIRVWGHSAEDKWFLPLLHLLNAGFNTLKNQGYNFEHNYGHGQQNLSVVFAMLMMLAFLVDQTQQLCCALFQAVWAKLGSKRLLWERMRALFYDYRLESMRELFEALLYGIEKHRPIFAIDSS